VLGLTSVIAWGIAEIPQIITNFRTCVLGLSQIQAHCLPPLRDCFECTTGNNYCRTGNCYVRHKCTVTCSLWSTVGKSYHYDC
jgi:hypothetical protein